ncbi:MAG: transglutaminase-like domain-containing protein [Candidatus Delongbacteria bacterium]
MGAGWVVFLLLALGLTPLVHAAPDGTPDAVIRSDHSEYEVLDDQRAVLRRQLVLELRNAAGSQRHASWSTWEDSFRSCTRFKAQIRDSSGRVVQRFDKGDLHRESASDDPAQHRDDVLVWGDFRWGRYPHTLELETEIAFQSLFFCPSWDPQAEIPVQAASFTLLNPRHLPFRTRLLGCAPDSVQTADADSSRICWSLRDLPPRLREPGMPGEDRQTLGLRLVPDRFQLGGVAGSFASWSTLANWFRELARGRAQLDPATRLAVREQVAGLATPREQVAALYSHLQRHTRYVSIQLGVGGWQPHSAQHVHEVRYGDCKDLSFYMIALLEAVDIPAWPALVRTRERGALRPDFPSNEFNHLIACVPLGADTLWLECTSDELAAGELPPSDEGLQVLLIGESGGALVGTPQSAADANRWIGQLSAQLEPTGRAALAGRLEGRGQPARVLRGALRPLRAAERVRWLQDWLEPCFPGLELQAGPELTGADEIGRPLALEFRAASAHWAQRLGPRWRVAPFRLQAVRRAELPAAGPRRYALELESAFWQTDTVRVALPAGYRLEAAPESREIRWALGSYRADYQVTEAGLLATREYRLEQRRIPADAYEEYRRFLQAVCQQDEAGFILAPAQAAAP